MSEEDALSLMRMVKERGCDICNEDRQMFLDRYACVKDQSNVILHNSLTENFGQFTRGVDPAKLNAPLSESISVKKKT